MNGMIADIRYIACQRTKNLTNKKTMVRTVLFQSARRKVCGPLRYIVVRKSSQVMCQLSVRCRQSLSALIVFIILTFYCIKDSQCFIYRSDSSTIRTIGSNFSSEKDYNVTIRAGRNSVVSGGYFSLVSFQNVPCNAASGDVGVCYSIRECTNLGGKSNNNCAGGYGVCCVLTVTCGGTVTINNTYFVNPDYPSTTVGPLNCQITVNTLAGASELYLEYTNFDLLGPTLGTCTNDSFTINVEGSATTYPTLCGSNAGQTSYIDLDSTSTSTIFNIALSVNTDPRAWKIRIVEFKPGDLCAAPAGCFQYYRDLSGTIQSFNFNSGQGQMLNNYCYQICFMQQPGYCNLLLTEANFMLSGLAPNDCLNDYILLNGEKFCGDTLNNGMVQLNQTSSGTGLSFIVCSGASNHDMDLGFNLNYQFLPCASG